METTFAAYHGDEPYVFVCYANADVERVYPEMDWLHDQGVRIWYYEGISAGKNWRETIGDSLLAADQILFFVSYASLNSDHCNREDQTPRILDNFQIYQNISIAAILVCMLGVAAEADPRSHRIDCTI